MLLTWKFGRRVQYDYDNPIILLLNFALLKFRADFKSIFNNLATDNK